MIKSWTLQNFKSVQDLTKLEFAPLTIFAGANSSGKSTILQSILLTAQTLQNSVTNKSIILNGHISRFGNFNDILSNDAKEREITIGFELEPKTNDGMLEYFQYTKLFHRTEKLFSLIKCDFAFSDSVRGKSSDLYQLQPQLVHSSVASTRISTKEETPERQFISIRRSSKNVLYRIDEYNLRETHLNSKEQSSLEFEVLLPTIGLHSSGLRYFLPPEIPVSEVGAYLSHFLPTSIALLYDKVLEEKSNFLKDLITIERDSNTEKTFNKYLNNSIIQILKETTQEVANEVISAKQALWEQVEIEQALNNLHAVFNYDNYKLFLRSNRYLLRVYQQKFDEKRNRVRQALPGNFPQDNRIAPNFDYFDFSEYIEYYFKRSLKYLGPLRDEPKPVYPLSSSSDPKDIGYKGENTAAVLELNKNEIVDFIDPAYFSESMPFASIHRATLIAAVLKWLDYMGIAEKVDPTDKGKLGHELKISTPGSNSLHDLTHVGVGVSQVLPILVLSLLSNSDSTLIFEQPELHLNPKVQTRLADFFFSMTLLNKQCLVETHSEYLINRLRFNIAKSDNSSITDNITMYFVEKEKQSSIYKQVKINQYGVIDDWPKGFFDENEENASKLLRAAMEKRKREKNQ